MPINKSALIRYKTIDNCLRDRLRKWTLDDLVEACADALFRHEGITRGISRRAIQLDIQNMRSAKLGYKAPIVVTAKKYYSYSVTGYSITNNPLTQQDLSTLNEVVDVLRQFKGFGYFTEVNAMLAKLEDKLFRQHGRRRSYIDFEKNELLKGLNHIDPIHKAILNRHPLEIMYKSFRASVDQRMIIHPYLLKEYRNRWFLLGMNRRGGRVMILALDRMEHVAELVSMKYVPPAFDVHSFFSDTIGVSKTFGQKTHKIILKIRTDHAPYVITKPLHSSQKVVKEDHKGGMIFSLEVVWNYELEREILGFGEVIQVLSPKRLAARIMNRLHSTMTVYRNDDEDLA